MNTRFHILGSSSSGNCGLLESDGGCFLIDAGFSAKRITELLGGIGKDVSDLKGIFLTHEHSDHSQGLRGFSKKWKIPCFANQGTAQAVQAKLGKDIHWQLFETGQTFQYLDLCVQTVAIPHDAYEPVGFVIGVKDEKLAWVTDLGYIPTNVADAMCKVQTLVIESNHDIALLQNDTKRPWSVKQRVLGRHGHLSNDATFDFIAKNRKDAHWKRIYLAHLSQDCNNPKQVSNRYHELRQTGIEVNVVNPESF